jgi:regulator of sirC expression with transglutaminase-like and TPR domain
MNFCLKLFASSLLFASVQLVSSSASAAMKSSSRDPALRTVEALLATPEGQIDFAKAKVSIDHLIDPKVNEGATLLQLDAWATKIRARFPAKATRREKLDILLSSLYQPGPWNDYRPFSYDLDDPLGANLHTKLISTYLATRKGNCVSMPILFAILGQKLGLPVTLATAPEHVLVKFLADDGEWLNVEATAGGFKFDSSYERETGMSAKAIQNEIYLRPLGPRDSVGVMLSTLMEFYARQHEQTRRVAVADAALKANPKDTVAMIHKATGYYWLLHTRYHLVYPRPVDIPAAKRQEFEQLSRQNVLWFAKAEDLGWTQPSEAQNAKYLDTIQREKAVHRGTQ